MKLLLLGLSGLWSYCVFAKPNELTVSTTSGRFAGSISPLSSKVVQFLSIPYAEAPTGEQRFSAPVLRRFKTGITNATTYGVSCGQYVTGIPTFFPTAIPDFGIFGDTGEDCLTLSIWAPASAIPSTNNTSRFNQGKWTEAGLPVVVYIPGGRFVLGGTNVAYQIPDRWVQRSQKHIVVTMK
jgi:carboxylesterase type B